MSRLDLKALAHSLAILAECNEKIADRGPHKYLPRPPEETPNIPALTRTIKHELGRLRVRRRDPTKPTPHDVWTDPADGQQKHYDLTAIGILEEIRQIPAGKDAALPKATTLVRVHFPAGEHVWFDPADLTMAPPKEPKAQAPKAPGA